MGLPAPIAPQRQGLVVPVHQGNNRINQFLNETTTPGTTTVATVTETHELVGITVPAGGSAFANLAGISFYFPFLSSALGINARPLNGGQSRSFVRYTQGTGLRLGTTGFQKVELQNRDPNNAQTVDIVVGGGIPNNTYDEYIDKRVIIQNVAGVNIATKNGPTIAVGFKTRTPAWADSLASGVSQTVLDGYNALSRKSIIFTNDDAAIVLLILDAAGNTISSVQPSTAWNQDVGGTLTLKNPGANPVVCHIGEVYYS